MHPRRLLKLTDTNLELQKTLAQANAAANAPTAAAASGAGAHVKGAGCVVSLDVRRSLVRTETDICAGTVGRKTQAA